MSPTKESVPANLEQALTDLPAKLRVHELAKRAGVASKDVIAALSTAGVTVASAASSVSGTDARAVLTALLGAPEDEPAAPTADADHGAVAEAAADPGAFAAPLFLPPAEAKPARRRGRKPAADAATSPDDPDGTAPAGPAADRSGAEPAAPADASSDHDAEADGQADTDAGSRPRRRRGRSGGRGRGADAATQDSPASDGAVPAPDALTGTADGELAADVAQIEIAADLDDAGILDDEAEQAARRRRRRGRRGRGRVGDDRSDDAADDQTGSDAAGAEPDEDARGTVETADDADDDESGEEGATRRRRRRRRRAGSAEPGEAVKGEDDPDNTVVHVREPRSSRADSAPSSNNEVQGVRGSTRLEAKRQRRRDSRDSRRRPQILTEAEFLARREAVDRIMAVRQRGDLAQVALLEDGILVEHFVSRAGSESLMGNIYLGKVQNVLPSMEAAFVDIGKGRNAVLYAGEVNWDAAGLAGKARRIETALSGGDTILVQVSKDPVGAKGARLTTQISLPGRFLVYVPGGGATGISRKLPDTERKRLKSILDRIVPEDAGVIIRTAAEGVAEEELARDVERLKSQWEEISRQADKKSNAPKLLSAEPDTLIKVVRDLFNSDISRLILDGDRVYESVAGYIESVAPELSGRVSRYDGPSDVFAAYRIDEQIAKALERKVYLPSGGSLVIDRTEAMTVIDVNTGKYTGSGGNLEETVTKNNLEAAEEVVRQLRLRDIGGIIVVDFIDMVLESNRELVMRRLTECLGRDRTRHQVAEVTSLGLVQMTRKKMGTGLVEAFSEPCPTCHGRGIILHDVPVQDRSGNHEHGGDDDNRSGRGRRSRGRQEAAAEPEPSVKIVQAAVRPPDPRGPKPPALGHADEVAEEQAAPKAAAVDGSLNAPRSRDASDAVSAVLAALDAQTAQRTQAATTDDGSGVREAPAPAAEPATGGRRRGRRAAGRPAGAPSPVLDALAQPVAEVPVTQQLADPPVQAPVEAAPAQAGIADGGPTAAEPTSDQSGADGPPARKRAPARRRGKAAAADESTPTPPVVESPAAPAIDSAGNGAPGSRASAQPDADQAKRAPARRRRAATRPAGPAAAPVPTG